LRDRGEARRTGSVFPAAVLRLLLHGDMAAGSREGRGPVHTAPAFLRADPRRILRPRDPDLCDTRLWLGMGASADRPRLRRLPSGRRPCRPEIIAGDIAPSKP